MRRRKITAWILIFVLMIPTIIIASTSTAHAFGGLNLDNGIFNILKGLLALLFLGKFGDENQGEQVSIAEESTISNNSQQSIDNNTDQNHKDNVQDTNNQSRTIDNWTSMRVNQLTRDEEQMLELLNKERISNGLKPLKINFKLVKVARAKSQDMINEEYFSHYSPNYGSPFDMMKQLNINYYLAGENIAGAPQVEQAHQSLMNSPSHKENILHPEFTHVGIGIINGGPYGKMYTQEFADLN